MPRGAAGYFYHAFVFGLDLHDASRSGDYGVHGVVVIEVEAVDGAEAVAQGGADHPEARGGSDEGEGLEGEVHGARLESFVYDPGDEAVFHGGVEDFFDDAAEAVYLVYE